MAKKKTEDLEVLDTLTTQPKIKTIKKVVEVVTDNDDEQSDDEVEIPKAKPVSKINLKQDEPAVKKPLKKKIIQTIIEVESDEEGEEIIQPVKAKRIQSEKQKQNTEKMRNKLKEYHERKREEKEQLAIQKQEEEKQRKKKIEDKIVTKAIAIKKKQIKQEAILDEISDDDTPIEEVKKIVKKLPAKKDEPNPVKLPPEPLKPKFIFI